MIQKYVKFTLSLAVFIIIILAILSSSQAEARSGSWNSDTVTPQATAIDNLLINPGMEGDYYWNIPNHYVAPSWNRWWIDGSPLPEYVFEEKVKIDGVRAQRWHAYNWEWTAGLYQVVENVMPCTLYEFTMWSRSHSLPYGTLHHKVGLDPLGTQYTTGPEHGETTTAQMNNIQWSNQQTSLYVWEQLSVETEALSDSISVVLFSRSEKLTDDLIHVFDSYWDAGTLIQVPFPSDRLPAPEGWSTKDIISNVQIITGTNQITIQWDTSVPASSQVWYDYYTPIAPGTATEAMTYTLYSPMVSNWLTPEKYRYQSELDSTPTISHSVTIANLPDNVVVMLSPLSRRPVNTGCVTSGYSPLRVTTP